MHQPTILITAYAVNPFKGSEDGMGWNFILQAARSKRVIAVTRINNGPHIRRYMAEHPEMQEIFDKITWLYFDWPKWMIFWKKGPLLSLVYYYGWQLTLALWLLSKRLSFDIAHNLNFHNDWTPSFLWVLGKPFVWGPVGHHPKIPRQFLLRQYGWSAYIKDRLLWAIKWWFWYADPFVYITRWKASHIFCMNREAAIKLRLPSSRYSIMPSVATHEMPGAAVQRMLPKKDFQVISVGRFVPLKGFDITIRAFAAWYAQLSMEERKGVKLNLVGTGPCKGMLADLAAQLGIGHCTSIIAWMPKDQLDACYRNAAVFFFPSHEGAGMVVAEAMSYGLPVLCFDNEGPGAFVHPASQLPVAYGAEQQVIAAFAQQLDQLFRDGRLYEAESARSASRFEEHFRWEVRGKQMNEVYNRFVPQKQLLTTQPISLA